MERDHLRMTQLWGFQDRDDLALNHNQVTIFWYLLFFSLRKILQSGPEDQESGPGHTAIPQIYRQVLARL